MLCWPRAGRLKRRFSMQRHVLRLSLVLAGSAILAACGGGGGGGGSLSDNDVAVVNGHAITKSDYDELLAQAKLSFKQNNRPFPKQGTTDYETVKSQVINLLVQQEERAQKAQSLGITITDKQITNRLVRRGSRLLPAALTGLRAAAVS